MSSCARSCRLPALWMGLPGRPPMRRTHHAMHHLMHHLHPHHSHAARATVTHHLHHAHDARGQYPFGLLMSLDQRELERGAQSFDGLELAFDLSHIDWFRLKQLPELNFGN